MANKDYALVPYKYLEDNFVKKGADTSWVGYRIMDESLTTQEAVIDKYGGTYWKLLSNSLGVYQWLRTDDAPAKTAYLGYIFSTTNRDINSDTLSDLFGGYEWTLMSDESGVYQWVCTNYAGGLDEVLPAYEGMIVASPNLPDALSIADKYGGTWVLLSNEDGVYQWQCSVHDAITGKIPSEIGEIIVSANLTSQALISNVYDGTWELLSDEDGVYQWERIS